MPPKRSLSDDQIAHVRWFREEDPTHTWSKNELATKFNVSIGCIHNIIFYWTAPEIEPRKPEESEGV